MAINMSGLPVASSPARVGLIVAQEPLSQLHAWRRSHGRLAESLRV
jgi:hypothetical protein